MRDIFVYDKSKKVPKDVTHVRVADGVEIIPFNAFKNCKHLESIEIPSSVRAIGINAFEGCGNITDVYVTNDSVWNNMRFMGGWCDPVQDRGASLHVVDKLTDCEVTDTQEDAEEEDELDDLSWDEMLDDLDGDEDWMDSLYQDFCDKAYALVEKEGFTDVFTEPSTQMGRGGDFFWAKKDGVNYRGNYDFESEQDMFWNCCYEADSREEAIELCAKKYASIILSSLKPVVDDLEEAAFSGGMAGDNSASGGTIRGRGASTQPGKNNYLNRMKSKNPDLVDTMVIKVSDIKPGMITQAGQVKEAEARNHVSGGKKMYIMHTNGYDGFWGLDETMDVMVDPDNKSKPFAGDYRALLKMGLQESRSIKEKIGDNYSNNIEYCPSCGEYLDGSDISDERDNSVRYTCYHCGNTFDRTKYYNESKSIDEALVTDYMDSETLHRAMQHLMFGTFNAYNQEENMIVKTTTNHGAFGGVNQSHRYFKFVHGEDGWEAYEVSSTGDKVGDTFLIDNI